MQKVIAIDGPSGSGKSTVARQLADRLGIIYVDTGAMFRALGLWAHKQGIDFENESAIQQMLESIDFQYGQSHDKLVSIDGQNLTTDIRGHEVSQFASKISKVPMVRTYLLDFQRNLAHGHACVMEGRDIGTVVFPQAFLKVFMTASSEVRAERRRDQLMEAGKAPNLEQILKDIQERDHRDSTRDVAPLRPADDAVELDTSPLGLEEVINEVKGLALNKAQELGISL